jgi:hypothetical protein
MWINLGIKAGIQPGWGPRGFPQGRRFSTGSYPQVWISMWIIPILWEFRAAIEKIDLWKTILGTP